MLRPFNLRRLYKKAVHSWKVQFSLNPLMGKVEMLC